VAALEAGDVDVLDAVPTTDLAGVRKSSSLRVLESRQFGWTALFINLGNTNGAGNLPYGKVDTDLAKSPMLRQAFEEAIDRNALNRVVYDGLYEPNCSLVAPANTVWYEATKVPCTPYAPKHARQLVAQSGLPNPTVRLLIASGGSFPRVAQFIQEQARAVGIDVVIDMTDPATSLARAPAGRFDAYLFDLQANVADPHETIYRFLLSSAASNRSGYMNPRVDLILGNTVKATDFKARATLYRAAQQIVAKDRPMIVLFNSKLFVGVSARVAGVRLAPNGKVLVTNARFR
jgi:peptide/nickel transport system substrate-binding protein